MKKNKWFLYLFIAIFAFQMITAIEGIYSDLTRDASLLTHVLMLCVDVLGILLAFWVYRHWNSPKKEIYLSGGCFWGTEKYLKLIKGVISTETGYANGKTQNPTYEQVYTDQTGFAECVHVVYDPQIVSLSKLTQLYFKAIDPVSLNRQGEDEGTRYRTGVYYKDRKDLKVLRQVFDEQAAALSQPLAVELLPLDCFYRAEEYHQDYLDKNPQGYCHLSKEIFDIARKG